MKMLRITGCSDPMMWYSDMIGQQVPFLGFWQEGYKSREPAGYVNVVRYNDAELVEVENVQDSSVL